MTISILQTILEFLYGPLTQPLTAFFVFSGIAIVVSIISHGFSNVKYVSTHIVFYNISIIIGRFIDLILVDKVAPNGTTKFFVLLFVCARLLRMIFKDFHDGGIPIPKILTLSIEKMEELDRGARSEEEEPQWDEDKIDEQISKVYEKLNRLEKLEDFISNELNLDNEGGGNNS